MSIKIVKIHESRGIVIHYAYFDALPFYPKWTNFGKKTSFFFGIGLGLGPINEGKLWSNTVEGEVIIVLVGAGDDIELTDEWEFNFSVENTDFILTFNTFFLFRFGTFSR